MPAFTVICPAHLECCSIEYTIQSVLNQTFPDFEFFIIGDGCEPQAKDRIITLCNSDSRLRFFDNPKGERHGEAHRHQALLESRGDYIVYISDDDLFLPNHLQNLLEGFNSEANFIHALPLYVSEHGQIGLFPGHINNPHSTSAMPEGKNFLPLTGTAHTRELYFSLPTGWSPAPTGTYSDLFMWQKFIASPNIKPLAMFKPGYIHFAANLRKGWTAERILSEIKEWSLIINNPDSIDVITSQSLQSLIDEAVARISRVKSLTAQVQELDTLLIKSRALCKNLEQENFALRQRCSILDAKPLKLLRKTPLLGPLLRTAGKLMRGK